MITNMRLLIDCSIKLRTNEYQRMWFYNDLFHSFADLPAIEWVDRGVTLVFTAGCYHRGFCWYKYNELHRTGGLPAMVSFDGAVEYYLNGRQVSRFRSLKYKDKDS